MSQSGGVDDLKALTQVETKESIASSQQQIEAEEYAKAADGNPKMRLKVYSPSEVYFEGLAFSLTATNETGVFDILPRHHNFISLLVPCDLIIRSVAEGEQRIKISGGMLHVKANSAIVFLDI